jgi:adenylate cyclase
LEGSYGARCVGLRAIGKNKMGQEIERKFLVKAESWRRPDKGKHYRQGYLSTVKERTVRVRTAGDKGFITVKGVNTGASRAEYEYEIPLADANEMLRICEQPLIEKTRYRVPRDGVVWEVDEFEGVNAGLITAEVELKREDQEVSIPDWVDQEVTKDPRYYNANLVAHPYTKW